MNMGIQAMYDIWRFMTSKDRLVAARQRRVKAVERNYQRLIRSSVRTAEVLDEQVALTKELQGILMKSKDIAVDIEKSREHPDG